MYVYKPYTVYGINNNVAVVGYADVMLSVDGAATMLA